MLNVPVITPTPPHLLRTLTYLYTQNINSRVIARLICSFCIMPERERERVRERGGNPPARLLFWPKRAATRQRAYCARFSARLTAGVGSIRKSSAERARINRIDLAGRTERERGRDRGRKREREREGGSETERGERDCMNWYKYIRNTCMLHVRGGKRCGAIWNSLGAVLCNDCFSNVQWFVTSWWLVCKECY